MVFTHRNSSIGRNALPKYMQQLHNVKVEGADFIFPSAEMSFPRGMQEGLNQSITDTWLQLRRIQVMAYAAQVIARRNKRTTCKCPRLPNFFTECHDLSPGDWTSRCLLYNTLSSISNSITVFCGSLYIKFGAEICRNLSVDHFLLTLSS
jgi:hypothetical protein